MCVLVEATSAQQAAHAGHKKEEKSLSRAEKRPQAPSAKGRKKNRHSDRAPPPSGVRSHTPVALLTGSFSGACGLGAPHNAPHRTGLSFPRGTALRLCCRLEAPEAAAGAQLPPVQAPAPAVPAAPRPVRPTEAEAGVSQGLHASVTSSATDKCSLTLGPGSVVGPGPSLSLDLGVAGGAGPLMTPTKLSTTEGNTAMRALGQRRPFTKSRKGSRLVPFCMICCMASTWTPGRSHTRPCGRCAHGVPARLLALEPGIQTRGGEGGRGFWTQNLVYQKWPDQIFPIANFVFSDDGHFGLGRGGGGFGEGVPPPLVFNYSKEALGQGV